ncbi:glycosyltransferase [Pedobacter frigidisoli]|uniref:Glycosyltransferase n=1 Tax=Pedobacter frigidisoli TaxID=2530455 RepID=A0A4R0P2C6_9SPHI|nr:glycosyltransferase [Pedobacter frigidisoli]TCD07712.1 glycosyltransferase [Pedobacter frigidisoli]
MQAFGHAQDIDAEIRGKDSLMMKIIHITASYKPAYIYGGPIQSVGKLCEALVSSDVLKLEVLTTTANGQTELDVEPGKQILIEGVPVSYLKRWTKDHSHFSPGLLWKLTKVIHDANADDVIVHIHAWWNLVSILSCLIARWHGVKIILSPRGMLTSYTQHNRNSLAKRILHTIIGKSLLRYCHVHATSEQEKRNILNIVQPKSITVIPNLVNYPLNNQELKHSERDPTFKMIFLSRIEKKKGLESLFSSLKITGIPWQLTIAGSGKKSYVNSLKLSAVKMDISEHIQWVGQVTDRDKFDLMATHDLLVLTSQNENFANVIIESLSVGTAVLISDQVGLADYVEEKDLGWVSSLSAGDISLKLMDAWKDKIKRKRIRSDAPEIISNDFSDEALADRYIRLYHSLKDKASNE